MVLLFWLFVFINIAAVVIPLVGLVLLLVAVVHHRNWQPGAWTMGLGGVLLVWLALFSINLALTLGALGLLVAVAPRGGAADPRRGFARPHACQRGNGRRAWGGAHHQPSDPTPALT
ncbi:hypothetical protein [Lacticaseibacillus daqingensis]|uniref:hypothetical protein n=1 Tax=Lacticaseibacillus daqingensis TaxID=2486014 RepID=UPI000F79E04D|nr:hypothetical protein [Lacticaseibacillus daqingensis]